MPAALEVRDPELDTEAEIGRMIMARTRARLAPRWGAHPDWEDICAEAFYRAWASYQRARQTGRAKPLTAVLNAIGWAPGLWFRRDRKDRGRQPPLRLDDLTAGPEEDNEWLSAALVAPDFAPSLLSRLAGEDRAERLLTLLTPRQREVFRLLVWEGLTQKAAATRLGCCWQTVQGCWHAGLRRLRVHCGLLPPPPPRPKAPRPAPARPRAKSVRSACRNGHPWVSGSWFQGADGRARCWQCKRDADRRHYQGTRRRQEHQALSKEKAPLPSPPREKRPAWRSTEANRLYMRAYRARKKEEREGVCPSG
jgi:DNA-directed RNA polymerase specialized sigma24 family protein